MKRLILCTAFLFILCSAANAEYLFHAVFPKDSVTIDGRILRENDIKKLTLDDVQKEIKKHPEEYIRIGDLFELCAKYNNNEQILQSLIDALKLPIKEQQEYLNRILNYSVKTTNNVEIIKKLTKLGANTDVRGYENRTVLMEALANNNLDIARYLIEAGADVKGRDERGNTALIILTERMKDAPDIVQMLIDRGVNVNAKNHDCCTAIGWTMACGLGKTYDLLVRAGVKASKMTADPNIPPLRNESCRRYCKNIYTSIRCLDEDDKTNVLDNRK